MILFSIFSIEVYDWQVTEVITAQQGFMLGQPDVAFRDVESDQYMFRDKKSPVDFDLNLDESPL